MDYLVEHPEVGTIRYDRSDKAKRIIISVKPEFVRVAIPKRQSFKNAQKFVESKLSWIKTNKQSKFSEIENIGLLDRSLKYKLIIRDIEEAWKSKEMEYFREIHRNGEYWKHPVCKKCVLSTSHFDIQNNL